MIGRYLHKYHDVNIKHKKTLGMFLLMTSIILILNLSISAIMNKRISIYAMDCSPFILISGISVFYLFKSFTFQSRFINYVSSSILAVYLLDGLRISIDNHFIQLIQYANSTILPIYVLIVVLLTFTLAILIDKARKLLFARWEDKLINLTIKCYEQFRIYYHRTIVK